MSTPKMVNFRTLSKSPIRAAYQIALFLHKNTYYSAKISIHHPLLFLWASFLDYFTYPVTFPGQHHICKVDLYKFFVLVNKLSLVLLKHA